MSDQPDTVEAEAPPSHRRTTMGLAVVAFFASAPGQSFLISVFVDEMLAGTGLTRAAFSGLYAAGTIVSALSLLALGRIIDRHGLRPAWVVISLALATACGLASVATGAVVAFFALATLRTFGQGSFPLLGTLLVARTFARRRGQAMAVAHLGLTGASILLPPLVAALVLDIGWRHSYQVLGICVLLLVLPLAAWVRTGPSHTTPAQGGRTEPAFPPAARTLGSSRRTVPTRSAATMLFVLAAPPLVGTALTFHAVSILAEAGLTFVQASLALSTLGATSALGTILGGLLTDRLSTRASLLLVSAMTTVAPLTLLLPHPVFAFAAFAVLGLGMGAVGVVNGTVWARTYGTAGLGKLQGTAQSSMITAAAVAPLVPALSHALTDGYTWGLSLLVGFAAATMLAARRWQPTMEA